MELIRKKEDELFKRWREHIKCNDQTFFVQDGALNPELYQGSSLKICSVLKETPIDGDSKTGYHFGDGFQNKLREKGIEYYKTNNKRVLNVLAKRISLIRRVIEGENNFDRHYPEKCVNEFLGWLEFYSIFKHNHKLV
jgi:hypothetical protein